MPVRSRSVILLREMERSDVRLDWEYVDLILQIEDFLETVGIEKDQGLVIRLDRQRTWNCAP